MTKIGVALWIVGIVGFANADIITSPEVTNWGDWAPTVDRCPEGTVAQGFQLLSETWIGPILDDTSLNGIRLFCGNPSDSATPSVTSSIGDWGRWRNTFRCAFSGFITGFQLKVERPSIIPGHDATATNNIRIFCTANDEYIEGDGEEWGTWSAAQMCPGNQVVCGIQTQVERDRGTLVDDTTLNNVAMECCEPPPVKLYT